MLGLVFLASSGVPWLARLCEFGKREVGLGIDSEIVGTIHFLLVF